MCKIVKLTGTHLKGDYLCNKYLKVIYLCNNLYLLIAHGKKTPIFNPGMDHRRWTIPERMHLQISKVPPFTKFYIYIYYIYIRTQSHTDEQLKMYCNAVWHHETK